MYITNNRSNDSIWNNMYMGFNYSWSILFRRLKMDELKRMKELVDKFNKEAEKFITKMKCTECQKEIEPLPIANQ